MPQSSGTLSRHSHTRRSAHRSKAKLKQARLRFAVFILLLFCFLFNFFFYPDKSFLTAETILTGLAYWVSFLYIIANSSKIKTRELTFYLVIYGIVAMSVIFFFVADKWGGNTFYQISGFDD